MAGTVANPYVGPRTFTYAERDRFFGREHEAQDLLSLVISERLVLFYAQSGAGKSSLINTRLVPQLKAAGYAVLPIARVGGDLIEGVGDVDNVFLFNLLLHLDQRAGDPHRFARMTLADFLARLTSPDGESFYYDDSALPADDANTYEEPIHVLIIDQFEEVVITHLERWQEREAFFRQLEAAMAADQRLWVVLTLREDYVAALDPYARLVSNRLRARFYMQRMGHEAALEAVCRPAAQYGRPFAPNVAEVLVDNLRQIRVRDTTITRPGQFVEPVQLQVVCYQLWENLKNRHTGAITMQDLQQSGDVDTALASFYEEAIASVLHDERVSGVSAIAVRNWFGQQLMTEAGTRGMVYRGETHTAGLPNGIAKLLEDRYLLRSEMRSGGMWYELVHDRFVAPILQANRAWWERQSPLLRDAQAWQEASHDKGKLYLGQKLQEALASVAQSAPEPVIASFLDASKAEQQALEEQEAARRRELKAARTLADLREQTATALRRRARVLVGVVVAVLIAAGAAIWFGIRAEQAKVEAEQAKAEAERAKNRAQIAQAEALRGQSLFLADLARQQNEQGQYSLAALLALEALPKSMHARNRPYVPEAEPQLYTAVINSREQWIFSGHQASVYRATFSPDGRSVVTASRDKTARLWDATSGELRATLSGHQASVYQATFSPDGRSVVTASGDKTARLWDATSGELRATLSGHQDSVGQATFSPDGRSVVTASGDKTARLWDTASGQLRGPLAGHSVRQAAFSPDGRLVVTTSDDKTARLWDAASGQLRGPLAGHSVHQAAFSPDGRSVVTASEDKTARLWRIFSNTQELIDYAMQIRPRTSDGNTIAPRTLTPEERQRFFLQ